MSKGNKHVPQEETEGRGQCDRDLKTQVVRTSRPPQSPARSKEQYRTRSAEGSGKTLESELLFFYWLSMC